MLRNFTMSSLRSDLTAGIVVFLVALPLCLGVALASNVPLFSGILAGIVGGIVVGLLSGSSTSVSGPAAGLTAIIVTQLQKVDSLEAFLTAIVLAGMIQVIFSALKMGALAGYFPSSVVKGLLWAIGLTLIINQLPNLTGSSATTRLHYGAAAIGLFSMGVLLICECIEILKKAKFVAPVLVIVCSVLISCLFSSHGGDWSLLPAHLVQVPVADSLRDAWSFLRFPDLRAFFDTDLYMIALTIAVVASLETLLNLEAVDKIDPLRRKNPLNRELFAQGVGNMVGGCMGALPVTSVIVRSSVNINAGVQTKLGTIFHGLLLCITVLLMPQWLNKIPLSALAAILIMTGCKLANPGIVLQTIKQGRYQFLPFCFTVVAIMATDLLIGVLIGLGIAICFILHSNIRRPIKKILEKHATGQEVLHIELPNQVSFFNRAALESNLNKIPKGGNVLIDATSTDYIDPDILDLIHDFEKTAAARRVTLSLSGFKDKYPQLVDRIEYMDFTTRELQNQLTPEQVLNILKEGNARFRKGVRLTRNFERQLNIASAGQFPLAFVLSCIDSRAPVELLFDLGIGDVFTARIAGNVVSPNVIGSIEYATAVAGAKLVVVMGHTSCGAVKAAVDFAVKGVSAAQVTGCSNLDSLIGQIQQSISPEHLRHPEEESHLNALAKKNVQHSIEKILQNSPVLAKLVSEKKISIVGAMYDIASGEVAFFQEERSLS